MPAKASCNDCYFRREGLCALPGLTPCPTFRAVAAGGRPVPPRQAVLVPRSAVGLAEAPGRVAAAPAA